MTDHLGLFDRHGDDDTGELNLTDLRAALLKTAAAPAAPAVRSTPRRRQRAIRQAAAKRRKRRNRHTLIAVLVLAIIAAGVVVGFKVWRKDSTAIPDFTGNGTSETVVRVGSGDTLTDIAGTLATDGVVASAESFINASAGNGDVPKIKTGYYKVRLHASAVAAVAAITDPVAHVGQLRLIPGRQLADITNAGTVIPGYISEITKKACVPLDGVSRCFTADQLWQAEETADPGSVGVVAWAIAGVQKAPDAKKRLEGILVPGDYDIPPNATALQTLEAVVSASAAYWNATDIVAGSKSLGRSPYQLAIAASLVEREGNSSANMPQVARVIYNRLAKPMKLQFDSTVDYSLGHSQLSTTAAERANPSPYNTYVADGLPPTPITSPGPQALDSALNPAVGPWLYFVKVDKQGDFCFSVTFAQHSKCVTRARANGVFGG